MIIQNILGMMQSYAGTAWPDMGSWIGAMMGFLIAFFILIFIGIWIYTSLAYSEIAKKLKYKKSWLAWIPFARGAMMLQLGGFNWGWIFLWLVPILGWIALGVLSYIANWRIYEKRKYSGWLALIPILGMIPYVGYLATLANLVVVGLVAWKDQGRK